MDRIVWDRFRAHTYVMRPGVGSRVLSDSVGRVVEALRSDDPARSAAIRRRYPQATEGLAAAGWLGAGTVFRSVQREPHLKRVQVEASLRCNLHCAYCYSLSGPGRRDTLGADRTRDVITQADALGVLSMDFTGGELMLDPDWRSYVSLARSRGIDVTVHTNGTLVDAHVATFLRQQRVRAVQVSLDSHVPALHDLSRGSRNALRRTLAGLDLLKEHGVPIRLSVMAHRDNLEVLGDTIVHLAKRYRGAAINVDRVVATGGSPAQLGKGLSPAEFWAFLRRYLSANVRAGRVCESAGLEDFEPFCGVAYSYVYVTAGGEIAACPTMTSREAPAFRGPAFPDTDLATAWYESRFFSSFRHTNCEFVTTCPEGRACGGGCRSNAYAEEGYAAAPDVISCNMHRNHGAAFVDFPRRYAKGERAVIAD